MGDKMGRRTTSEQYASDRLVKVGNIVGMIEIAARTGSTPHAVWNWTKRYDFPQPVSRVSNKPVYDWAEVDVWNQNWVRSKGGFHTHQSQRPAKKAAPKKRAAAAKKTAAKKAPAKKATARRTVTRSPMARARRSA